MLSTLEHVRRVLVVDDGVGAARMLQMLVKRLGPHEVEIAYDGPSALEAAQRFSPDLVLLDIGLPRMDGYEVARRLREFEEFAGATLVALTGYSHEEDRRRSSDAGFDEHVVKPIELETLKKLLASPKRSVAH
jgi:CheY-like chemotaxis protein